MGATDSSLGEERKATSCEAFRAMGRVPWTLANLTCDPGPPTCSGSRFLLSDRGRAIADVDEEAHGRRSTRSSQTQRPGSSTGPGATIVVSGGAPVAYSVETTSS